MRIAAQFAKAVEAVIADDGGQDLIEYALLTAIIGISGVLAFSTVSTGMKSAYESWDAAGQSAWVPPCPTSKACP